MNQVNWWLFGLSFAMGLVLTLAFLARPIKHEVPQEVPVDHPVIPDPPTTRIVTDPPTRKFAAEPPTTKIAAEPPTTRKIAVPYGPGSAHAGPDGRGPAGWLVKARSDTRLYYTPDNPTYDPTIAQVWFKDEQSALRAGFTPWHPNSGH
jgi:uncharacterized membrane protein ArfC